MIYDEEKARAWTRAVPHMTVVGAVVLCVGAGFCFFAAIYGLVTAQVPAKRALLFALMGLLFLAVAAHSIAMGRRARRISAHQPRQEPKDFTSS
jgi:multisubunit Na+/H+ antiporter MnhG subunit